jgi:hypothetical protein
LLSAGENSGLDNPLERFNAAAELPRFVPRFEGGGVRKLLMGR